MPRGIRCSHDSLRPRNPRPPRRRHHDRSLQPAALNPNSYNLTLHDELMVYEEVVLDMAKANRVRRIADSAATGWCSAPTSSTWAARSSAPKRTTSCRRSKAARRSAGWDCSSTSRPASATSASCGYWTLEMFAVQPVRIYAGVPICQIFYHEITGDVRRVRQQVPAQPRHPAEPAVQRARARARTTTRSCR